MRALLALLLASCGSVAPHYYEAHAGYAQSEFDRPVNDFETPYAGVTLGWFGDRYFRDLGKSNAYWGRYTGPLGELGEVPGRIEQDEIGGVSESALFAGLVPDAPKTKDEGIAVAWWGLGVLLLAVAVYVIAMAKSAITKRRNGTEAQNE
jgi:hypothetical protein